MTQVIYIILFFTVLLIALKKKVNISFIFVYFLSSVIYFYNAFEGEIFIGKLNQIGVESYSICNGTYIILIMNMILTFLFLIVEKEKIVYVPKEELGGEQLVIKVFVLAVFSLSVYMALKYNVLFRTTYNKSMLNDETGSLGTYFKYLAMFSFVFVFIQEGRKYSLIWKILSIIPILSTFLYGNRSFLVIAILAVIFDKVYQNCKIKKITLSNYIKKHKRLVIGLVVFVFVVFVIKGVTDALFIGNFELVKSRLTNPEYYKQVFYVSEPNTIMRNLDTIVLKNYQLSASSYKTLWAYLIPLATSSINNALGVENFTYTYQRDLFGTTNRASTYLGEAFANGGYLIVAFVILINLSILALLFRGYLKCRSNVSKCTLLLMGIDIAFYMQRNSIAFQLSRIRDYIYIAVILFVVIWVNKKDHKIYL